MLNKILLKDIKEHGVYLCGNFNCFICGLESHLWDSAHEYFEARKRRIKWIKKLKEKKF